MSPGQDAAIVGIHEWEPRLADGRSAWQIKAECAARALDEAGLGWGDVDALYDCGEAGSMPGFSMAEYLGVDPTLIDNTSVGGSSFELHAAHAADAIAAGRSRVGLLTYGSTKRSGNHTAAAALAAGPPSPFLNMEQTWGLSTISDYALVAGRHMAQYGTTEEQLAEIAVAARDHALRNPSAVAGLQSLGIEPVAISIDDVLSSPMMSDPLHLLDCCLVNDGGGAVVIASAEVAKDCRTEPVWVLGHAEATKYLTPSTDITVTAGAVSGPLAFERAGVSPDEIDVAAIYDSFTITVLTALEDLGFCAKGEGGAFVQERLRPGGSVLPVNTDGGGLSSSHPGMRGIFLLIEAARQLRGTSTSQRAGARLAVVHGVGGWLATRHVTGTVILGAA